MEATLSNLSALAGLGASSRNPQARILPFKASSANYGMGVRTDPVQDAIEAARRAANGDFPIGSNPHPTDDWNLPPLPKSGGDLKTGEDFAILQLGDGTQIAVAANIATQAAIITAGKIISHAPLALLSPALFVARTLSDVTGYTPEAVGRAATDAAAEAAKRAAKESAGGLLSDTAIMAITLGVGGIIAYKILF